MIDNDDIITYTIYIQGMLIKYQTMRGGRVMLQDITKPTVMEWNTPMEAMMTVFNMEKEVSSAHILSWRSLLLCNHMIHDMYSQYHCP